jgi:NADH-quinone oxidoreductase subunit G
LSTWKQMIDLGSMQDGQEEYRATARRPVARLSRASYDAVGSPVTITGDRGSVTLPAQVAEGMPDGVVWVPANSFGNGVLADLASPGSRVTIREAE